MAKKPHRAAAKGRSRPYQTIVEKDVYVAMRDGVRIALVVYRPKAEGQFPALFAASPYQYEFDDVPAYPLFPTRETGPVDWYVGHGYVYIHADVRGSGRSEGTYRYFDKEEQLDYYELVEWIAQQPWCTGKVGGIGQSYFAVAQWFTAALNPPHLTCIAPYDARIDNYRDAGYHGGIFGGYQSYWYNAVRHNNRLRPANAPTGKMMEYDLGYHLIDHAIYDSWWKERCAHELIKDIKVPVFSIGHWGKLGLHLRGNILGYEDVISPKKLLITGAASSQEAHHLFDTIEFHEQELLPFYDHYLKGIDNGFMEGPPVKIFVRGEQAYRTENEWPLKRAKYVSYYLRKGPSKSVNSLNDGALSSAAPPRNGGASVYSYPDWEWRSGVVAIGPDGPDPVKRVLTFTSPELDDDMEVTGPIVLELYALSDQTDMEFIVKIADQRPQPPEERKKGVQPGFTNVSKGWLKASHRKKDEKRTTAIRPFYTHEDPQPVEPGRTYKFDIEVLPTSYVFRKGHRIRLEITNGDSALTDHTWTHPYPLWKGGTDTIHHDAAHPSRILLPVVPRKRGR